MLLGATNIELAGLIISIFIGLISAGTFWEFLKWYIEKRKDRLGMIKGMEVLHEVYEIMQEIIDLGPERVVLFAGHNQGGVPRPTCGFWVSALHGLFKNPHKNIVEISDFKNLRVDLDYIKMLLDIQNHGYIVFKTDEAPHNNLRRYYEADGITESLIIFLGIQEKKFLYLSVCKLNKKQFKEEEITRILLKTERIKSLINQS